jgi:hypothetical protein
VAVLPDHLHLSGNAGRMQLRRAASRVAQELELKEE